MSMKRVRVAVNGYGVIGKRVADAVELRDDMELVGAADVVTDYRIRVAVQRGYPVYAATAEAAGAMQDAGIPVAGTLGELLAEVDVVADCTPKRMGAQNLSTIPPLSAVSRTRCTVAAGCSGCSSGTGSIARPR